MDGDGKYSAGALPQYAAHGAMPQYGSFQAAGADWKTPFSRGGPRRSISPAQIAAGLLVPWLFFAVVFALESMPIHYSSPQIINLVVFAMVMFCLGLCVLALGAWRRRFEGADPFWLVFIAATAILAFLLGFVAGLENFEVNMVPFMDIANLNVYTGIDPAVYTGQQLMDAGRIKFTDTSMLNIKLSMGFRNLETYCVAPIVANSTTRPETYDFWAVGLNCCSGHLADFHCGEFSNPSTHSGVRLMRDDYRGFFKLAVQQAEAAYNIKAEHPIFVYWLQEPQTEISAYEEDAYRYLLMGLGLYLGVQLVLVGIGAAIYARS